MNTRGIRLRLFFGMALLLAAAHAGKASDRLSIYHFRLDRKIDEVARNRVADALGKAVACGSDYIILELDTYGGALDAADSIRSSLLQCPVPVVAFINMQAASAGALISIACDSIYMKSGSSIGAATVVNGLDGKPMPDKYQSFMRAMMRSTAEATGRDPKIAERMVDTANVLSFTPSEAMEAGYCEGICEHFGEAARLVAGDREYVIVEFEQTGAEKAAETLLGLRYLFLLMIFGGIYIEMKTPGVGLPIAIAFLGAVLYFSPLYIVHLAQNWEIALFIVGLVLLALELFVIPGFGVSGILGILAIVVSLVFAAVDNAELFQMDGTLDFRPVIRPMAEVVLCFAAGVFGGIWLVHKLYPTRAFDEVALRESLGDSVGVKTGMENLAGMEATVFSDLKPTGKVEIGGRLYEATVNVGYVSKGEKVTVTGSGQGRLYCKVLKNG